MKPLRRAFAAAAALAAATFSGSCRGPAPPSAPPAAPRSAVPAEREIAFLADRATGGSVTVAPDGSFAVFSLLGDLYRVPAAGGPAVALTSGPAWDAFPRLSPDGSLLAFVSDREFWRDDVFLLELASGRVRRVTRDGTGAMTPAFSLDGREIGYVRQSGFTFQVRVANLATGEDRAISQTGRVSLDPFALPEGWGYSEVRVTRSDPPVTRLVLVRKDGSSETLLDESPGTVFRTVAARDGRTLVFRRQLFKEQTVEILDRDARALVTGARALAPPEISSGFFFANLGQSGNPAVRGGEALFFREGRLLAAPLAGGPPREIPFSAPVSWRVPVRSPVPVKAPPDGALERVALMNPRLSPDGKRIAFGAVGDAWLHEIGAPGCVRLTDTAGVSETPIGFLPDGSALLVRLRGDEVPGPLRFIPTAPGGRSDVIGKPRDEIEDVSLAPDGDHAVAAAADDSLLRIDLETGAIWPLGRTGSDWSPRPAEDAAGSVTFLSRSAGIANVWRLEEGGSSSAVSHLTRHAFSHAVTANGKWFVVERDLAAYRLPHRAGVDESRLERLSSAAARSVAVAPDGRTATFADGTAVHLVDVETLEERTVEVPLALAPEPDPEPLLVRDATLWDGTGAPPRGHVSIRIARGRVEWIGPANDDAAAARGARVLDAKGLFAIPGLVEMHSHTHGTDPRAFLAYGITSVRDTGGDAAWLSSWRARSETGAIPGPRLFMSGEILEGAQPYWVDGFLQVERPGEAETTVEELASRGAAAIKVYPSLARSARRAAAAAANARSLRTIGHGATLREIGESIADGLSGLEHSPDTFLASDVTELLRRAEVDVTPTLGVMGLSSLLLREEPRWLADPLFRRVVPDWHVLESRSSNPYSIDSDESLRQVARSLHRTVKALFDAGVRLTTGTDAPNPNCFHGPSLHWEIRFLVLAGLDPAAALAAATREAARSMGADGEIGTIEAGKRADLLLLEASPLADIRNTERIEYVVRGGRVHRPRDLYPEAFAGEAARFDAAERRVRDLVASQDPATGRESGGPPLPDLSPAGLARRKSDRADRESLLATFDAAKLDPDRAPRLARARDALDEAAALDVSGPIAMFERAIAPFAADSASGAVDAARLARVLAALPEHLERSSAAAHPGDAGAARRARALLEGALPARFEPFPGVEAACRDAAARLAARADRSGDGEPGETRPGR